MAQNNETSMVNAMTALKGYAAENGTLESREELFTEETSAEAMSDLLADLMHLCDDLDLEFDFLLGTATRRYNEEV